MVAVFLGSDGVVVSAEEPEDSGANDAISTILYRMDLRSSDRYDNTSHAGGRSRILSVSCVSQNITTFV